MNSPITTEATKVNLPLEILYNILITSALFFLVHYGFYGSPFFGTIAEIVQTLLLSAAYAYLYTKASYNWRINPEAGFMNAPCMLSSTGIVRILWLRIGNSLLYSTLTVIILLTSMYLAGLMMVHLYMFLLEGVRGALPPPDYRGTGVVVVEVIVSGLVMEKGKTEDKPRN